MDTIAQKILMALTGLFLCLFLVVHLVGNLPLLMPLPAAQLRFNAYSEALSHNPLIRLASLVTLASVLVHTLVSLVLTRRNRSARSVRYAVARPAETSPWYARRMGLLGTILLLFLLVHMRTFWWEYKFGEVGVDAAGRRDLYGVVVAAFQAEWYTALYVLCMGALGYHLLHGVASASRTLGLHHRRYGRWLEGLGITFAVGVSAGFAVLPVFVYIMRG